MSAVGVGQMGADGRYITPLCLLLKERASRIPRRGLGVRGWLALLMSSWLLGSAEAGPAAAPARPAGPYVQPTLQVLAPPILYPYYVLPFFPFLWPAPPVAPGQALSHPYPVVIWLPFPPPQQSAPLSVQPPPAVPVSPPGTIPSRDVPSPPAVEATPTPALEVSSATVPAAAGPQGAPAPEPEVEAVMARGEVLPPVAAPEASPSTAAPQSVQPAPVGAESARPVTPVKKPRAAMPARKTPSTKPGPGPKPTAVVTPVKRKLCWREGRLDVCP